MLADKEIIMAALNLKSMSFDGGDIVHIRYVGLWLVNTDTTVTWLVIYSEDRPIMGEEDPEPNTVNMLLDVSFATNVRYLDEQVSLQSNSVNSRL